MVLSPGDALETWLRPWQSARSSGWSPRRTTGLSWRATSLCIIWYGRARSAVVTPELFQVWRVGEAAKPGFGALPVPLAASPRQRRVAATVLDRGCETIPPCTTYSFGAVTCHGTSIFNVSSTFRRQRAWPGISRPLVPWPVWVRP